LPLKRVCGETGTLALRCGTRSLVRWLRAKSWRYHRSYRALAAFRACAALPFTTRALHARRRLLRTHTSSAKAGDTSLGVVKASSVSDILIQRWRNWTLRRRRRMRQRRRRASSAVATTRQRRRRWRRAGGGRASARMQRGGRRLAGGAAGAYAWRARVARGAGVP